MVVAAGGDVHRAENFFVLDVRAGDGENLCAEAELTKLASGGIGLKGGQKVFERNGVATEEFSVFDAAIGDFHQGQRSVFLEFHGELAASIGSNPLDFACG